jgi:hypothetical protein
MRITFETYNLSAGLFVEFAVPYTDEAFDKILSMRNTRNIRIS